MLELSVVVFGKGIKERSHWAFMLRRHKPTQTMIDADMLTTQSAQMLLSGAELFHVVLLDSQGHFYQYESRPADSVSYKTLRGRIVLANLLDTDRMKIHGLLGMTPAPCDGIKSAQDWIVDAMIELEVAEIAPSGMSELFWNLTGHNAADVGRAADGFWVSV